MGGDRRVGWWGGGVYGGDATPSELAEDERLSRGADRRSLLLFINVDSSSRASRRRNAEKMIEPGARAPPGVRPPSSEKKRVLLPPPASSSSRPLLISPRRPSFRPWDPSFRASPATSAAPRTTIPPPTHPIGAIASRDPIDARAHAAPHSGVVARMTPARLAETFACAIACIQAHAYPGPTAMKRTSRRARDAAADRDVVHRHATGAASRAPDEPEPDQPSSPSNARSAANQAATNSAIATARAVTRSTRACLGASFERRTRHTAQKNAPASVNASPLNASSETDEKAPDEKAGGERCCARVVPREKSSSSAAAPLVVPREKSTPSPSPSRGSSPPSLAATTRTVPTTQTSAASHVRGVARARRTKPPPEPSSSSCSRRTPPSSRTGTERRTTGTRWSARARARARGTLGGGTARRHVRRRRRRRDYVRRRLLRMKMRRIAVSIAPRRGRLCARRTSPR